MPEFYYDDQAIIEDMLKDFPYTVKRDELDGLSHEELMSKYQTLADMDDAFTISTHGWVSSGLAMKVIHMLMSGELNDYEDPLYIGKEEEFGDDVRVYMSMSNIVMETVRTTLKGEIVSDRSIVYNKYAFIDNHKYAMYDKYTSADNLF